MENNTGRMGFALIAISVVAFVLLAVNGPLKASASGLFTGLQSFQKATMDKIVGNDDTPSNPKPDPNDSKWVQKGNYGTNGYFVMDADGNGIVYALDDTKQITVTGKEALTSNNTNLVTLTYIDKLVASKSLNNFFTGNTKLTTITGLDKWSTDSVNDMSYMFMGNSSLTSLDLTSFKTNNVQSMNSMFRNMSSLASINLSSFSTNNVADMGYMFAQDAKLTNLDLSAFNTANVRDMSYMFQGLTSLASLNIKNFDASNVNTMKFMFQLNSKLKTVDTTNVIYTKVASVDSSNMFVSVDSAVKTQLSKAFLNK